MTCLNMGIFDKSHPDIPNFECTEPSLTTYFTTEKIVKEKSLYLCACHVLYSKDGKEIIGYFTLSTSSVNNEDKSKRDVKGPYKKVPVVLLGRFAVASKYAGNGHGKNMLKEIFAKYLEIVERAGSAALLIEPLPGAISFYQKFPIFQEFQEKEGGSLMFLAPTQEIKKLFI